MTVQKCFGWLLVLLITFTVPVVARDVVGVSINDDAQYSVIREVDIKFSYSGTQMPTEMRIYATGETDWSEWFAYTDSLDWVLSDTEGLNTIEVETRYWVESKTDTTVYGAWRVIAGESTIVLDMTPPVLTASLSPEANEYGWYNTPVSVTFQVSDAVSGIATSPDNVVFDQEGAGQSVTVMSTDRAGNGTAITVSGINIDLTPPVLTASVTPDANENGWYNGPVSVVFQTTDAGSGIVTFPENATFDQEGAGQSIVVEAVDRAGNKTEIAVNGINIDMTPPALTASLTPEASEYGWYNTPVSVTFQVTDAGSGIATSPDNVAFDQEGAGQSIVREAVDKAGNKTEVYVGSVNIDLTPPVLSAIVTPAAANENGWYTGPVSVNYAVSDALSGVASVPDARIFSLTSHVTISPRAIDKAGNVVTLTDLLINIDIDAPSIVIGGVDPGAAPDLWVPGPVTVAYTSSDAFAGVGPIKYITGGSVIATDGGGQISSAQVSDLAGNTAAPISVRDINIDSTLPTTTVLLADSEGASGASVHDPVVAIDLKAKLDAFGTYDADNVALGYSFADADLTIYATVIEIGATGTSDEIQSYQVCEFAPVGGFYYFILPARLVSGQLYEIWFEEISGSHIYKAQVVAP
ncbi:hypothetical protein KAH43_09075 [Candidatus Bipolaricaulota bacterium]|nr:hypothetical protein [Candidatus Bipolaricaulota bacterium]